MKSEIILYFALLVLLVAGSTSSFPINQEPLKEESTTTTPASIIRELKSHWKSAVLKNLRRKKSRRRIRYNTTKSASIIEKYESSWKPSSVSKFTLDPIKINIRKKRSSLLPWSFFSRFVTNKLDLMTILVDTEISPPAETETEHQRKRRDLDKTPLLTKSDMNSSTAKNETEVQHQLKHYNLGCNPLLALLTLGFLC